MSQQEPEDTRRAATCDTHGDYVSELIRFGSAEHWSKCPACIQADKQRRAEEDAAAAARDRKAAVASARMARFGAAMIPPRYVGKSLDDYQATNAGQARALKIARRYVERWADCRAVGRCLVFIGGVGTGKTHLAAAIANGVLEAGSTALFRTVPDAIAIVKASYSGTGTEADAYARMVEPDLLVLDEVGAVRLSDHDAGVLYRILGARHDAVRPTIITSNAKTLDELETILGDRLVDRLLENNGIEVLFDWESHRRRQPTNGS